MNIRFYIYLYRQQQINKKKLRLYAVCTLYYMQRSVPCTICSFKQILYSIRRYCTFTLIPQNKEHSYIECYMLLYRQVEERG